MVPQKVFMKPFKAFMKPFEAIKAFMKPFEVPQRRVENKNLIFSLHPGLGREGLNLKWTWIYEIVMCFPGFVGDF